MLGDGQAARHRDEGGGAAQRISFGDGSYSQPAWSPRGDYIAFTKRGRGGFAIGIMRPDGTGERILTEGFHNEAPNWAPNGQYILFFRDPGGQAGGKEVGAAIGVDLAEDIGLERGAADAASAQSHAHISPAFAIRIEAERRLDAMRV